MLGFGRLPRNKRAKAQGQIIKVCGGMMVVEEQGNKVEGLHPHEERAGIVLELFGYNITQRIPPSLFRKQIPYIRCRNYASLGICSLGSRGASTLFQVAARCY
jgi:hypothetical protein